MKLMVRTSLALMAAVVLAIPGLAGGFFPKSRTTNNSPVLPASLNIMGKAKGQPVSQEPPTADGKLVPTPLPQGLPGVQVLSTTDTVVGQYDGGVTQAALATDGGLSKVSSKKLNFHYELKDVGPSGVNAVEVWCTRDGAHWEKFANDLAQVGGTVSVDAEGTYGFTFVPRTGFGGGKEVPATGDVPQVWVEVDVTKPVVTLTGAQPSPGSRSVGIQWVASDKNLGKKPIVLYYGESSQGPWIPCSTPLDNTGSYVWTITPGTPTSFWLRVEVTDQAGNVSTTESQSPVRIDLAQPAVTNIRISAGS